MKAVLIFIILQFTLFSFSQEMKVNSIIPDVTDLSAKINPRYSSDGRPCSLLKITCPQSGISFRADGIVGDIDYENGEYKLYADCNTKEIMLMSQIYGNLNLILSNYNIIPLQSHLVYHIIIDLIKDISIDERVRLFKLETPSDAWKSDFEDKTRNIKLTSGLYGTTQEKELSDLFYDSGIMSAGVKLGSHYIGGFINGDSIPQHVIDEGEFLLKVAVEYDDNAYASKLLGDYFYNSGLYNQAFEYYFIGHTKQNADASNCLALMMENGLGTEKDVEGALEIWRDVFWNSSNFAKSFASSSSNNAIFEHFVRLKKSINTLDEFYSDSIYEEAAKNYDKTLIPEIKKTRISFIDWEKVDKKYYPRIYNTLRIALNKDASIDAALYFLELFSRTRPYSLSDYTDMDIFYPDELPDKNDLISKSIIIIKEAASRDDFSAMKLLSRLYLDGKFVEKNDAKALEILACGSELGDSSMAAKAADVFEGAYKYDQAFHYSQLAYDLGNRNWNLVLRLADNYATGKYCAKDPLRALKLYNEILPKAIGSDKNIIDKRIRNLKHENNL